MKIATIAPYYYFTPSAVTGDTTQMRMTVKHLRQIPEVEVDCLYFKTTKNLISEEGKIIEWKDLSNYYTLVHIFGTHRILKKEHIASSLSQLPSLISTIYWNNFFREYISVKNGESCRRFARSIIYIFNRICNRKYKYFSKWCLGILPNSWAEGDVFQKTHKLRQHSICYPIPNAIITPNNLPNLNRPQELPQGDYIVCPGIFAPRKNQINLIRAMKGYGIPIVFLGKEYDNMPHFKKKCQDEADEKMYFLGHIPSTSEKYWAILKHARVAVLVSDCETPGIAILEAAAAGARPVVPIHGGTQEYYGMLAEYLHPASLKSIRKAVTSAWERGRLTPNEASSFSRYTWEYAAQQTFLAYKKAVSIYSSFYNK